MESQSIQPYREAAIRPDIANRRCFERANTSVGAVGGYPAGHLVRIGGMLAPLVVGELVKDPDKRWRWIRIISLLGAGVSEILWAQREHQRRQEREAGRCR